MLNIISGVTGQDGSYLAEILLAKKEKVIGFSRRTAVHSTERIDHLLKDKNFTYLEGCLTDQQFIWKLMADYKPDKFFNLGAQSHVATSFTNPASTFHIDTLGVLNVLEAIRTLSSKTRLYQASTSELFGKNYTTGKTKFGAVSESMTQKLRDILTNQVGGGTLDLVWGPEMTLTPTPITEIQTIRLTSGLYEMYQDEDTPFVPQSPYAIAKLAAHHLIRLYRESYGLYCCSGILFNHESPRRGENFVTQKIIKWIVGYIEWMEKYKVSSPKWLVNSGDEIYIAGRKSIEQGFQYPKLRLGNLDASRDWGHAYDYMLAADLILSQEKPDDFVVGTGETHTIREFLDEAFSLAGIKDWESLVVIDPKFIRPSEVPYLRAKPDKIKAIGWKPTYTFSSLVKEMFDFEMAKL